MSEAWHDYRLLLGLPQLAPGRLSEVELLKHLGALQWRSVAALADQPESGVLNEAGQRLHFSMISVELGLPAGRQWEEFDEGMELVLRHRLAVFGRKLVDGYFLFDREPIPDDELAAVAQPADLARGRRPWAYLTHGFASRGGTGMKHRGGDAIPMLETPAAFLARPLPELRALPAGVADHVQVERTGRITGFADWDTARPLCVTAAGPFAYPIAPEADLNVVGSVYCARFPAIMATAERRLLRERLAPPLSGPLVACLSTEHRRLYYFANAAPDETLQLEVTARILPAPAALPARLRTMARLLFRTDLRRGSDGVLMASALTRKVLLVPGEQKAALLEAERRRDDLTAPAV